MLQAGGDRARRLQYGRRYNPRQGSKSTRCPSHDESASRLSAKLCAARNPQPISDKYDAPARER